MASGAKVVKLVKALQFEIGSQTFKRGEVHTITDAKLLKQMEIVNEHVGTTVFSITEPKRTPATRNKKDEKKDSKKAEKKDSK